MRAARGTVAARLRVALLAVLTIVLTTPAAAHAEVVRIAVAANFAGAARDIGVSFETTTGHRAILSFGSTGHLYAQIAQGAPFDVFLAADRARPRRAVEAGLAVASSRITYAVGRLVLYSAEGNRINGVATLKDGHFARIAIPNPATAPYGAAAVETMGAIGVLDDLKPRLVRGNNVAQAYQFIATGNAEIGFVALSQIAGHDRGSRWLVPETLHTAIAQDAVLLTRGAKNVAARAFMAFLGGAEAQAIKKRHGYGAGADTTMQR